MVHLHFYHPLSRARVQDYSSQAEELDFTVGLNGSVKGSVKLKETASNSGFLATLGENSHFLKVGMGYLYGAVIESVQVEKGIWTLNFCGAYEYLEKIDAVASHKAALLSNVAWEGDYSSVKVFYADSTVGVLYEVMKNLTSSMSVRGYDSSLFEYSSLRAFTVSNTDVNWNRSYRLNSIETPTLKSVVDDVLKDDGMELFRIRVSQNAGDSFQFILEVVTSAFVHTLSEAGYIAEISRDDGNVQRRAYSIAKGTDLMDRPDVERVVFDGAVAYSSLITATPQERSGSIRRAAEAAAVNASQNLGNLKFSSFYDDIDLLDYVEISSARMPEVKGIVTEKSVTGIKVTYTLQVGEAQVFNGALQKATDVGRRIIFNQLNSVGALAVKTAGRQPNSTGWRT